MHFAYFENAFQSCRHANPNDIDAAGSSVEVVNPSHVNALFVGALRDECEIAVKALLNQGLTRVLERVMGIEPTLFAWEAKVLPLNYTRLVKHYR
jgi:hypothetical protein